MSVPAMDRLDLSLLPDPTVAAKAQKALALLRRTFSLYP